MTLSRYFPTTPGALFPTYRGGPSDAFVVTLSPRGDRLLYGSFFGGRLADGATAMARDPSGRLVLVGWTWSPDLPVAGAVQSLPSGPTYAFVARLDPARARVEYATYLGGVGKDAAEAVAIDPSGAIVVAAPHRLGRLPGPSGCATGVPRRHRQHGLPMPV